MKNLFNKKNKGELSTQQIILLIILIVSFAIILFLLFRLNFGGESEKDVCHNSVVLRGNSVASDEAFPLKCSRSYVCITKDKGCEELLNPEIMKVKTQEEIYQVLADEMANCWWMFGEGEIDYIGDKALERNYCSVCSQILFDESLNEIEGVNGKINKDALYDYMSKTEIEEGQTYLDYLFGTSDVDSLKQEVLQSSENDLGVGTFGSIDVGEQAFVLMGIKSQIGNTYKWIAVGIGVVSLPVIIFGSTVAGVIILTGAVVTGTQGGDIAMLFQPEIGGIIVEGKGIKNEFLAPTIVQVRQGVLDSFNCKEIVTLS